MIGESTDVGEITGQEKHEVLLRGLGAIPTRSVVREAVCLTRDAFPQGTIRAPWLASVLRESDTDTSEWFLVNCSVPRTLCSLRVLLSGDFLDHNSQVGFHLRRTATDDQSS